MDRGVVILQELRKRLNDGWMGGIRRATGAHQATFVMNDDGAFTVRVVWKVGEEERSYEKKFTKAYVLGASIHKPMAEWSLQKRACDHARDIMREVLALRGAL
jgi:hypothetical protein